MSQDNLVRRFIKSMPATEHLGIEVLELGDGVGVLSMDNRPQITFDGVTIQGGIVSVLADYAAVAACGSTLPEGWLMATTSGQSHNLAPARGERLVAVGEVIKPGKRLAVARADVFNVDVDGTRCLTGTFTAVGLPPEAPT